MDTVFVNLIPFSCFCNALINAHMGALLTCSLLFHSGYKEMNVKAKKEIHGKNEDQSQLQTSIEGPCTAR